MQLPKRRKKLKIYNKFKFMRDKAAEKKIKKLDKIIKKFNKKLKKVEKKKVKLVKKMEKGKK